jgi:hypothetical protein
VGLAVYGPKNAVDKVLKGTACTRERREPRCQLPPGPWCEERT